MISKGIKRSNPFSANLLSTFVQAGILTALILSKPPELNWGAVALFALGGILALGIGRLLNFISIDQIGVATSSAIIGSNPLITTLLTILFLGETVLISTLIGASLVVTGIYLISGARAIKGGRGLFIPFLSALSYSSSNIISKMGLNLQPDPLLSAQIGAVAGVLGFFIYLTLSGKLGEVKADRSSLGFYSIAGFSSSVGWITLMKAMEMGSVPVVTTIVFAYPIFSLMLSWIFLKGQEDLGRRVVTGCLIIVSGVIIVTLF